MICSSSCRLFRTIRGKSLKMSVYDVAVRVEDGVCSIEERQIKQFLTQFGNEPYTSCRTMARGTKILLLKHHADRLVSGSKRLLQASELIDEDSREESLKRLDQFDILAHMSFNIRRGIEFYRLHALNFLGESASSANDLDDFEFIATVVFKWTSTSSSDETTHTSCGYREDNSAENEREGNIFAYVYPLRKAPDSVQVEFRKAIRHDPSFKSLSWVAKRAHLEDTKHEASSEVVMYQKCGITEGIASNFFAVYKNGVVCTASSNEVLSGTLRSIVISACEALGLTVEFKLPKIAEAASWDSCFITATSRLVAPIDSLVFPEEAGMSPIHFASIKNSITERIRIKVEEILDDFAEDIIIEEGK